MKQLLLPHINQHRIVTDPGKIQGYLNAMLAILKHGRHS